MSGGWNERSRALLHQIQEQVHRSRGVTRKKAKLPTREFVEEMVRGQYKGLIDPPSEEELQQVIDRALEAQERILATDLPSPYEDPHQYHIITTLADSIEKAAARVGREVPFRPLFGTLASGRVNAMAVLVPGQQEYLIFFESGLFGFANLLCKAVSQLFSFEGTEGENLRFSTDAAKIRETIAKDPMLGLRYFEAITAYVMQGDPHRAPPYAPVGSAALIGSIMRSSMELFVLGHEYGHVLSGHFDRGRRRAAALPLGTQQEEVVQNWREEIEADSVGLELMLSAMQLRGIDPTLSYCGADFFFCCIDAVERAVLTLETGETREEGIAADTHPPTSLRREALRRITQNSVPSELAKGMLGLADSVDEIMDALWEASQPVWLEMHQKGYRPDPIWR